MQRILSFILILIAHAAALSAQRPMTLNEAVDYALTNHPDVQVAQLQVNDAAWRVKESLASGLPQLSAGVTYTGFLQRGGLPSSALSFGPSGPIDLSQVLTNFNDAQVTDLETVFGGLFASDPNAKIYFSPVHNIEGKVGINQLVFNNSYLIALRAARHYDGYVREQLAAAKQAVRNKVIEAYIPALLISENVVTLDKNLGNLDKLLSDTRAINKAGFAEQLDVDRLDLSTNNLRSERGNLVRQREIVVNALKLAMGMPIGEALQPSDDVQKLLSQYGEADLTTPLNLMNRPEYLQLLKGRDLAGLQVELYQKPWLPTVAAFLQWQGGYQGGFGTKDSEGFNDWFFIPNTVGGLSVSLPLYDGGGSKAKRERAMIQLQTIDVQKQMLENALALELDAARKQYLNAAERVQSQQKNLALAQRIYDTTQIKYKSGVGSSFEVTQAEQALYTAQQALTNAQFDLLTAKVAIRKALGNN